MLLADNVVGNQEDWAQFVTLSDEHETPLLRMLPKGKKPTNILGQYQADTYDAPTSTANPDGKDWETFKTAGANRAELNTRCQWFINTCSVSKLAQDVTNAAGVPDELAREIPKKLTEMARSIEATAGSDQAATVDDGATGNKMQGIGLWVQSGTTNQLYATPSTVRPASGQIYSGTLANLHEDAVKTVLQTCWTSTGSRGAKVAFVGPKLKRRFSDFQYYIPSSTSTQSTSRVTNRDENGSRIGGTVDFYDSDFGDLELHLCRWLAHENFGGSAAKGRWRGYILNKRMWEWRWNQKPTVYKPEFKGGSYKAAMDAILTLACLNPVGEGKIDPSDPD